MNQINYILIVLTILCSNVLAQQDTNNSNVQNKILTYKDTQVIYQTGPDGVNAGPYLELEGFEDPYFPPVNWQLVSYNFNPNWQQVIGFSNSGFRSAAIFCDPYNEAWLISPAINLTTATNPYLKYFEYVQQFGSYDGYHNVLISTDYTGFGDPNFASWDYIYGGIQNYFSWDSTEIDLSDYIGFSNVYIAFQYLGNGDDFDCGTTWFIDDVVVDDPCFGNEPVPDCATIISPPNGATSLQRFVSLFWYPPFDDVSKQFFYLGTDGGGIITPTNVYVLELESNVIGIGPVELAANTTYYWQIIPANCSQIAVNCPIWSFTTNDGEVNFGAGGTTQGGYYFANSTAGASGALSQPIFSWIDISTNDLIGSITDNQTVGPFPLGFTFNYFGTDYTAFYINSNGFITFSTTSGQTNFPYPIPALNSPNNVVAGYWKDLDPTNSNVLNKHLYYGQNSGDMVITFENYPESGGDVDGWITFQIIIKPSGNIKIQYQNSGSTFDINSGTVGIENSDGTRGILYRHREYGGAITASLALEFSQNESELPVELTSFTASIKNAAVNLNWETSTEVNNYGFEVERASSVTTPLQGEENYDWMNIGFVNGNGNSNSQKKYSFDDPDIQSGKHHYRLKQIDNDGKFEYSNTIEVELNVPLEYQLAQNYPNPFNPSTKINYQIPKASNVSLKVYDVLGNEVATLVDDYREAGDYELNFDAGKLSGGVYFYQLNASGFSQTRKMLLLK